MRDSLDTFKEIQETLHQDSLFRNTQYSTISSLYENPIDRPLGLDISKFTTDPLDVKYSQGFNDMEFI